MITLLSPAKSLDYKSPCLTERSSQTRLKSDTAVLIDQLKKLSSQEVGLLMNISDNLSVLNHERFQKFAASYNKNNSRQAILAFTGDVYQGMNLSEWSADDFATAQENVRILSGLYGVLRPLDLMQPYRLEMGTSLANERGKNLYQFWGDRITGLLNKDLEKSNSNVVVNLASKEYFSSVIPSKLNGQIISPVFKDEKKGKYKIISFYAKKARGMMADYIVKNELKKSEELREFSTAGYTYDAESSTKDKPVFLRAELDAS